MKRTLGIVFFVLAGVLYAIWHQTVTKPDLPENKGSVENKPFIGPIWTPPENTAKPTLFEVRMRKVTPSINIPTGDGTKLWLAFEADNPYAENLWISEMEIVWQHLGKFTQIPGSRELGVFSWWPQGNQHHPFRMSLRPSPMPGGNVLEFTPHLLLQKQHKTLIQIYGRKDENLQAFLQQNRGGVYLWVQYMQIYGEDRSKHYIATILPLMSDPMY